MVKLVLVRHADYDPDSGSLDADGVAQVERLATLLRDHLVPPVRLFYSGIRRTTETAALLAEAFAVEPVELDLIKIADDDHPQARGGTSAEIDEVVQTEGETCSTVVLVTHDPVVQAFLNFYLRKHFGSTRTTHPNLWYAEAVVVDGGTGRTSFIRQG